MTTCYQPLGAIEIREATEHDLPTIADLAHRIWRAHYPAIIGHAQTEYMLAQRYTPEALQAAHTAANPRFVRLDLDGECVAFAGHGPADDPNEWKLHQLYVLPEWHGRGLGGRLIRFVEHAAASAGRTTLVLTVNRSNQTAITAYQRAGFTLRSEAEFDIGSGFRMVDFVMSKPIPALAPNATRTSPAT